MRPQGRLHIILKPTEVCKCHDIAFSANKNHEVIKNPYDFKEKGQCYF